MQDWSFVFVENVPRQWNGCDCGVFAIMIAESVSQDLDPWGRFTQEDMPLLRRRIAADLVRNEIL